MFKKFLKISRMTFTCHMHMHMLLCHSFVITCKYPLWPALLHCPEVQSNGPFGVTRLFSSCVTFGAGFVCPLEVNWVTWLPLLLKFDMAVEMALLRAAT